MTFKRIKSALHVIGDHGHHVAHDTSFQRIFLAGHGAYFTGHTFHLPVTEFVTGTLALMVAVEFAATFAPDFSASEEGE